MLGLVTMLMGLGCAPHHRPAETVEVERFDIHIEAHFGALVDTESHRSIQAATDADLKLQVALTPVRLFRDGSLGSIVSIESASLRVSEGGADRSMPLTLVGRTAELRTFPNGEILDIGWGDRLAGLGRYLDVFEVVFPAISPSPPTVDDGEEARRRIIWPFRGPAGLRWDNAVEAIWTNQGVRKVGEEEAWQIHYEGPWTLRGPARTNPSVTSYMAEGQSSGTVGLELSSGLLVSHDFEWQRTAVVSRKRSLQQTQTFVGHVERIR